ncbi:ALF repeat-containing protein [Kitasatospora sp. NPDC057936]|uniref:ALF repeat-containing protein n=1 Tax=Kitasatospora sp. NPDC057936 TaxID=3346283 RepID=UPI0036DF0FD8
MKLPKVSAVIAAAVLAPAVLFPSSAAAADSPQPAGVSGPDTASDKPDMTEQEKHDRAEVQRILADKESGVGVREAAEKALKGGAAELRRFLEVELAEQRAIDNQVRVAQLINNAGPVLKQAAKNVLRNGTPEDVVRFLKEGQFTARAEDEDRAKVQAILDDKETGAGVREAGEKALKGDAAAVRHFLDVELPGARVADNRVKVAQILSVATGRAVRDAAKAVLRNGTDADVVKFLKEGQFTARAEDDRVETLRIIADKNNGRHVQEGAQKALNGTAADVRRFLEVELPQLRASDNRIKVSQIVETGGPAVKKAALQALDGSNDDIANFLKEGWAKARAQDEADAAGKPAQDRTPDQKPVAQPESGQGQGVQPAAVTAATGAAASAAGATAGAASASPGQLAATGADGFGWEAGGAAAAVAAGAALVAVSRRRRSTES